METEEQTKQYRNSIAEFFGSLSLAVVGVSFVGNEQWANCVLIAFGVIFALIGIYIILPFNRTKDSFFRKIANKKSMSIYKAIGWFIALAMFGYSLTTRNISWLTYFGIALAIFAYIVLIFGICRARKIKN